MPRKGYTPRKDLLPDPKYSSILVTRFVNAIMRSGKKSTAERIMYDAIGLIEERTGQEGLTILKEAVNNVRPAVEVKSRRVGGATYQVPMEVRSDRQFALAIRWLISYARGRGAATRGRCWKRGAVPSMSAAMR